MILILSETKDFITDKVIEWISIDKAFDFIRINEIDKIQTNIIRLGCSENCNTQFTKLGRDITVNTEEISFFWYRRGGLYRDISQILGCRSSNEQITKFLSWEWKICADFMLEELQLKSSLGNYFKSKVNKLKNLRIAVNCGFKIPATIISENNHALLAYNTNQLISKPISEAMIISDEESYLDLKTNIVDNSSENFFPSLCQEKIEKWIELRVFVSYNEIYAMAIFSQKNSKTEVDYRNYDEEKRNRFIPFHLSKDIEERVLQFMNISGLDTGSIDFILTPEKEYIFLEINPAGNIEMVSEPCNYYLEKRIAEQILERIPS